MKKKKRRRISCSWPSGGKQKYFVNSNDKRVQNTFTLKSEALFTGKRKRPRLDIKKIVSAPPIAI